jgi:hypothetical protein
MTSGSTASEADAINHVSLLPKPGSLVGGLCIFYCGMQRARIGQNARNNGAPNVGSTECCGGKGHEEE